MMIVYWIKFARDSDVRRFIFRAGLEDMMVELRRLMIERGEIELMYLGEIKR